MIDECFTVCVCSSRQILDRKKISLLVSSLRSSDIIVKLIPDLCKLVSCGSDELDEIAKDIVVGCHSRAMNALFASKGITLKKTINIREENIEDALLKLQIPIVHDDELDKKNIDEISALPSEENNDVWFPIIDKDKCVSCGKCFDFCLFDVYSFDNGEIKIINPQNCKINCPACARICPSQAIIFPKYDKSPINGGTAIEEVVSLEMKDIYNKALRERLERRRAGVRLYKKD